MATGLEARAVGVPPPEIVGILLPFAPVSGKQGAGVPAPGLQEPTFFAPRLDP